MSWITVRMDLRDNQVKIDWIYLRKFVLGTIRGDQFMYILLEFDCYSVSFFIPRSPSLRAFPLIYAIFPLSSLPYMWTVDAHVDPCPISILLKSLGVAVRLKSTVQRSLPH